MKKFLLYTVSAVLFSSAATAQTDQTIYAKPLVNQAVKQPEIKDLYADAFKLSDVNNDRFISENEFSYLVDAVDTEAGLTKQEQAAKKERLLKTFGLVDTNRDNKLDADEFYNFMVAETQIEAQKRFNKMSEILNSPDPDAAIQKNMEQALEQLHEASDAMQKISPEDMAASFMDSVSISIANENYFQMDKDKDGCATKEELVSYMLVYQQNQHKASPDLFKEEDFMTTKELEEWFDSIDKKNPSCLTKEEYVKDFSDLSAIGVD